MRPAWMEAAKQSITMGSCHKYHSRSISSENRLGILLLDAIATRGKELAFHGSGGKTESLYGTGKERYGRHSGGGSCRVSGFSSHLMTWWEGVYPHNSADSVCRIMNRPKKSFLVAWVRDAVVANVFRR